MLGLLTATPFALLATLAAAQARVEITLTDEPGVGGPAGSWRVEVEASRLPRGGEAVVFEGADWGWPSGWTYLEVLDSDPAVARVEEGGRRVVLEPPRKSARKARIEYRVHLSERGSERHRSLGLLPNRGDGWALGYLHNVLLLPRFPAEELELEAEIEVVAADRGTLVTGWGGHARGKQATELADARGNGPLLFGEPAFTAIVEGDVEGEVDVECFQYTGPDHAGFVADLVARLAPLMARHTGWPARSPNRVFLSDAMGGGMGSAFGLHVNLEPDAPPAAERGHWFRTIVAHELFHDWLGIRLHEASGSLVWFREGFTEYFAQWTCAATGVISREQFAENLEEYDRFARSSTSLGKVAFADPEVQWRDGDGPNELMAYRGAPVLALALDAELRRAGHAGLLQLLRDLLAGDEHVFPPERLREWFLDHGMEERWNASVAGLDVPLAADSLLLAGFEPVDAPIDVAYLGIEAREEKPLWHVLSVDPDGPAAAAGVLPGDVIDGFFPFTGAPTPLMPLDTPYTFGLDIVTPGIEGTFLGIQRDGEKLQLFVDPELRPWGVRTTWKAGPATDAFFSFEPE